jgi:hypothetical protein
LQQIWLAIGYSIGAKSADIPLHFNGVHLLKRVVENTGGIDGLESQVLVVKVTNKQTLGGESVGLDIHIGAGDASEEAGLSNVGVTADEQGPGVGVDGRKTAEMLADLVEIQQRILQSLDERGHATEGGSLELLALVERLCVFQKTDVISGNCLYQVLGSGHLAKGNLEVVRIVEGVEQILVERVDVLETGKAVEDGGKLVGEGLLGELDLSGVESCLMCE